MSRNDFNKPSEFEELIKQIRHPDGVAFSGHLIENVVDEIALEGLDGITLQALKIRLTGRPNLDIEDFEDIAPAVWNQLKYLRCLNFFYLPQPRPDLIPYTWDKIKDEKGNPYEPLYAPEEIYLYYPVEDKEKGIRGSCQFYNERSDVSRLVRRISYHEAIKLFGNRLVVVAEQDVREKALFGENYKKHQNLSIVQYCIMERVGRARHAGETTRGKVSLQCLNILPKTLFYNRKYLLKAGIVTRQTASMKYANCKCPAAITVFHLPRFYRRVESVANLSVRQIFSYMNNDPNKCIPIENVIAKHGKHTLRNLRNQFPMLVESKYVQEVFPEPVCDPDEALIIPEKKKKPRTIHVLRLKITDINVQNQIMKKVLDGESVEEENSADGGDDEKEEGSGAGTSADIWDVKVLRSENSFSNITDSCRLYQALLRAGTSGLKQTDFTFLKLTNLEARSATRFLSRHNVCKEGVIKMQKQKAFTFTFTKFMKQTNDIKLHLEDRFSAVKEEIKNLRRALYEQKVGRFLEIDGDETTEGNPVKPQMEIEETYTTSVCIIDPTGQGDQLEKSPSKKLFASPKKASPKKKSKSKSSSVTATAPSSGKKDPSCNEKNRSELLAKAIENIPRPTLCLVTVQSLKSETIMEDEEETTLQPEQPSIIISTRSDFTPQPGLVLPTLTVIDPPPPPPSEPPETEVRADGGHESSSGILPESQEFMLPDEDDGMEVSDNEIEEVKDVKDAVDEEIRSRMVRQRVDWNEPDDRFILFAFIASILFIPKYSFSRIFIFNSTQIRDLMLRKSGGLSNKTSLAIRRRVHFLKKQKSFYEKWVALMSSAVKDEQLYMNYLQQYLRPPQQKIYLPIPMDALEQVYDYLVEKYKQEQCHLEADTRSSLREIETLLFLRQFKRAEFFWKAMMFIIFCPMGMSSESRAKFRIFWRNFLKTSSSGGEAITTEANNAEKSVELEADLEDEETEEEEDDEKKTPEELYLEYVFKYLKFLGKQLRIMFDNILMLGSGSKKRFELVPSVSGESPKNICLSARECGSSSEVRLWTARSFVLDLVFSGDPKRLVDKTMLRKVKLPIERAAKALTHAKILVCRKPSGMMMVARMNLKQFVCGLPSNAFDETLEFLEYINEASNVDSLACISSGILYGIVELLDYFKSKITFSESVFTLNDEWVPVYDGISLELEEESKKGKKRKADPDARKDEYDPPLKRARKELTKEEEEEMDEIIECFEKVERDRLRRKSQAAKKDKDDEKRKIGLEEGENYVGNSTDALRLLRIRLNEAGVNMPKQNFQGFVERDFFTINLPSLEFVFPKRNVLNWRIHGSTRPFSEECLKELRASLVELVYHSIPEVGADEDLENHKIFNIETHLKKYKLLFDVISLSGTLGVSGKFLGTKFEWKSLGKGLRYLLEAKLIFSVGVTHRRFVSYNNVHNWIIAIRQKIYPVGHVVMRPWITPFGGLSWNTVNRLFVSLLGQLQRPEIRFDELCEVFTPTLSRVEVIVLIEALAKLKYVALYRLQEPKVTLFSQTADPSKIGIDYSCETLIDTQDIYVVVSPYTTFLHAQLQSAIHSAPVAKPAEEGIYRGAVGLRTAKKSRIARGR